MPGLSMGVDPAPPTAPFAPAQPAPPTPPTGLVGPGAQLRQAQQDGGTAYAVGQGLRSTAGAVAGFGRMLVASGFNRFGEVLGGTVDDVKGIARAGADVARGLYGAAPRAAAPAAEPPPRILPPGEPFTPERVRDAANSGAVREDLLDLAATDQDRAVVESYFERNPEGGPVNTVAGLGDGYTAENVGQAKAGGASRSDLMFRARTPQDRVVVEQVYSGKPSPPRETRAATAIVRSYGRAPKGTPMTDREHLAIARLVVNGQLSGADATRMIEAGVPDELERAKALADLRVANARAATLEAALAGGFGDGAPRDQTGGMKPSTLLNFNQDLAGTVVNGFGITDNEMQKAASARLLSQWGNTAGFVQEVVPEVQNMPVGSNQQVSFVSGAYRRQAAVEGELRSAWWWPDGPDADRKFASQALGMGLAAAGIPEEQAFDWYKNVFRAVEERLARGKVRATEPEIAEIMYRYARASGGDLDTATGLMESHLPGLVESLKGNQP